VSGEASGKYSHHAYAKAQPWTTFKGKQVGRKEVSAREVFRPGHKANPALEGPTSSGSAYGAGLGFQPAAKPDISRKQFGSYGQDQERDSLGPVDLEFERHLASQPPMAGHRTKKKSEEPPPDTLRWDPSNGSAGNGRGSLAREARRKAQVREEEEARVAQAQALAHLPQQPAPARPRAEKKDLTEPPSQRAYKSEAGQRHQEQMRVRAMLEAEALEKADRMNTIIAAHDGSGPLQQGFRHPVLEKFGATKVAQLTDPRVTAALQAKLNAPNVASAELYKMKNTQRISAERRY